MVWQQFQRGRYGVIEIIIFKISSYFIAELVIWKALQETGPHWDWFSDAWWGWLPRERESFQAIPWPGVHPLSFTPAAVQTGDCQCFCSRCHAFKVASFLWPNPRQVGLSTAIGAMLAVAKAASWCDPAWQHSCSYESCLWLVSRPEGHLRQHATLKRNYIPLWSQHSCPTGTNSAGEAFPNHSLKAALSVLLIWCRHCIISSGTYVIWNSLLEK